MRLFYGLLLLLFASFTSFGQSAQTEVVYRLILIGDAGLESVEHAPYQQQLNQLIQNSSSPYAIVMLGDNIYPKGMPSPGEKGRAEAERVVRAQMKLLNKVNGPIYYLPGNHDWAQGRRSGLQNILNQKAFFDSLKDERIHFLPADACPGPVEIPISENATLVILDSQWFLHPWEKPETDKSTCDAHSPEEVYAQLEDILNRNQYKRLIVAAHHPIITYGDHGGVYTLKDHLFPLTDVNKSLYLPLPVIGSVYPLYRKIFGNIQDVHHPIYRAYAESVQNLMEQFTGTIYAAGHEHNLQYNTKDGVHYVVSGSGSKKSPVKVKGYSKFGLAQLGFSTIEINRDGSSRIQYFDPTGKVFEQVLDPISRKPDEAQVKETISSGEVTVAPSDRYKASASHEKWLGSNYRKEWSLPLKFPVFDIGTERGGLKILQTGGGMQTLSLRLEDNQGREYTLRSIEKYPEKAVPTQFKKTFAEDLVQDQISASHPYGALVVPFLARAAGIYHTNPKVVYVPDDPRLGIYRTKFANQLMLFEERPSGTAKDLDFFGNADKIISTAKLLEKLAEDNDNRVDEKFVLRNRLFDLWIGDWDRHDDQWRWAEFDEKKGKSYRPIPRDRDQAFFVSEGIFPSIWSRKWALPKFQGFDDQLSWPSGFMYNGRYFDRSFLTALPKEDWVMIAEDIASRMTDEVIENAIRQWPKEVFELHGEEIIRKLKSRRSLLTQYALDHYLFLAREVDVVGSNKRELFEVEQRANGNVKVVVSKLTKADEKGKEIFAREFYLGETNEIRIYGQGGDDKVVISGGQSKIKVRVIGGDGQDQMINESKSKRNVFAYDLLNGASTSGSWTNRFSSHPSVNAYNRKAFLYDRMAPLIYANLNIDDGLFVGGGFIYTKHGFRKRPYKAQHLLLGSFAFNTASFNFKYDGRFTEVIGKWNVEVDADVKSPNYVNNFFGMGNESVFDKKIKDVPIIDVDNSIQYYRLRFKEYALDVRLSRKIGSSLFISGGPAYQRVGIEDPEGKDRFIKVYSTSLAEPILEKPFDYAGASASWGVDKRNHPTLTTRGIYFQHTARYMKDLASSGGFQANTVSLSLYQSFRLPAKVTFAFRVGGGINTGTYQLYQSQILDGKTEIRGFRKTRFYGDQKLFFNHEVRIKLTSFRSYLFPASLGILGFYDVGRVWYKDENGIDPSTISGTSTKWHKGFGGGIWFTPFNMTALSTEVGHSDEGTLAYVRLGFLF